MNQEKLNVCIFRKLFQILKVLLFKVISSKTRDTASLSTSVHRKLSCQCWTVGARRGVHACIPPERCVFEFCHGEFLYVVLQLVVAPRVKQKGLSTLVRFVLSLDLMFVTLRKPWRHFRSTGALAYIYVVCPKGDFEWINEICLWLRYLHARPCFGFMTYATG